MLLNFAYISVLTQHSIDFVFSHLNYHKLVMIIFQGGMKAVIWTDTLQTLIMFTGMLAVIIQGFINQGWNRVWQDAIDSGRLDLFE